MTSTTELIDKQPLERLADETGTAIAFVDAASHQIAALNNNSICRRLNPGESFSDDCARYCGRAFEKASEAGGMIGYECHAGLECRAVLVRTAGKPTTAIIGRTFVRSENYRKATERAISGDWSAHSPAEFFENILLTASMDALDKAAKRVETELAEHAAMPAAVDESTQAATTVVETQKERPSAEPTPEEPQPAAAEAEKPEVDLPAVKPQAGTNKTAEARAWRSFFSSLLKTDYARAANSILEFLAHHHGFKALAWLEKRGDHFENAATFGEMKNRRVRLGIAGNDKRLIEAFESEMPLELGERPQTPGGASPRTMFMFPVGIAGEVKAAIAVLDPIKDQETKRHIARMCHSIAPQLEILQLRGRVDRSESVSTAVQRFGESLKIVDADDLWLTLTQTAAELMRAERASLLIYDEGRRKLAIKAMIGTTAAPPEDEDIGRRVAKGVFARSQTAVVSDVALTGLKPAPRDRRYKTDSFISFPVEVSGRTIGVMNFTDRACGKPFDKRSVKLLETIGPHLAIAVDRAMLKEKTGTLEQLSVTDGLTGMLNRRYIEERLMEEVKRSKRDSLEMSFMMLDVDNFKSYNDQFGHPAGDEALKLAGQVIRETLRDADVAARFGGEEFSILLPQTTSQEAAAIAERIRANMQQTDFPNRPVTVSIGVASCSAALCSSRNIVAAADKALYEAKRRGRNRVIAFETMNQQAVRNKTR
jgi:diguanylate cyclase (GGDEF)-like protein